MLIELHFHERILLLLLRNLDLDLLGLYCGRSFDHMDALLQLLLCLPLHFLLVSFHPIEVFTKCQQQTKRKHVEITKLYKRHVYTIQVGVKQEPLLMESPLPCVSDFNNHRNRLEYILSKNPVISLRPVSLSLTLKGGILKQDIVVQKFVENKTIILNRYVISKIITWVISFPCTRLYALVHFTLRGFLFILKFLWHFDLQNRNICAKTLMSRI